MCLVYVSATRTCSAYRGQNQVDLLELELHSCEVLGWCWEEQPVLWYDEPSPAPNADILMCLSLVKSNCNLCIWDLLNIALMWTNYVLCIFLVSSVFFLIYVLIWLCEITILEKNIWLFGFWVKNKNCYEQPCMYLSGNINTHIKLTQRVGFPS